MGQSRAMEMFANGDLTVILGDGFASRMLALRLWLADMPFVICDRRRTPWSYVFPFSAFLCFGKDCPTRLMVEELCELADRYPDGQKFLIADASELSVLSQNETDELEYRYIFSDPNGIAARSRARRA